MILQIFSLRALRPSLLLACLFTAATVCAQTPIATGVFIQKSAHYEQTSPTEVISRSFTRTISAYPSPARAPQGSTARLIGPGGITLPMALDFGQGWYAEQTFASEAELDAATPEGTYRLEVLGTTQVYSGSHDYVRSAFGTTRITNFAQLQAWPGPGFTVEWDPIPGATANSSVAVQVGLAGATSGSTNYAPRGQGMATSLRFRWYEGLAQRIGQPLTGMLHYRTGDERLSFVLSFPLMLTGATVYTYAGHAATRGQVDGPRETATLSVFGLAFDRQGNLFCNNFDRVRKISPAGVVTTFVHQPTPVGSVRRVSDFYQLSGLAVDASGTVYVVDGGNQAIKKISPSGEVTLLAGGGSGDSGSRDGVGSEARFWYPTGIAASADGTVYVCDTSNCTIRKITSAGVVTTLAGQAGMTGSVDGVGASARFRQPLGIALDVAGNIYVGDGALRRITPDGTVTTLPLLDEEGREFSGGIGTFCFDAAGNIYFHSGYRIWRRSPSGVATYVAGSGTSSSPSVDGMANSATISPSWFAADPAGNVFFSDEGAIRTLALAASGDTPALKPVTRLEAPLAIGSAAVLSVEPVSTVITGYQWRLDDRIIPGATSATLLLRNLTASNSGNYTLDVFTPKGKASSGRMPLGVGTYPAAEQGRLSNLSVRTPAGEGDQSLIVGFTLAGDSAASTKSLLVRGIGPALARFGVTDFASDPTLTVFHGSTLLASNDNWAGNLAVSTSAVRVGAFPLLDVGSRDAALQIDRAAPGGYSALVVGRPERGTVLAEIYDAADYALAGAIASRLSNLSARAAVGGASGSLTAGFVIGGTTGQTVLLRAVGPGLAQFGLTDYLANPQLELYRGTNVIAANDDWGGDGEIARVAGLVGAFALSSATSKDAVLCLTLAPGAYTAVVRGGTGVVLVEAYVVR